MATRMYFHDTLNAISGTFPSTEQSSLTAGSSRNMTPQTENRVMNETIGTAQVTESCSFGSSANDAYVAKFVSPLLGVTSITAQTWTFCFAGGFTGGTANYMPSVGTSAGVLRVCVYIWRPSTGAKIANIFDANVSITNSTSAVTERTFYGTFSGAAVTSEVNDVIIFEMWNGTYGAGSGTLYAYYDGTTVTTTNNTNVTSIAAFLETPQNSIFVPPSTDTTVTRKTVANKFITVI